MAVRKPAAKGAREGADERLLVEAAQSDPAKFGDLYDIHFDVRSFSQGAGQPEKL